MAFLLGDDRILSIKISGSWTPIACLTSNSLSESTEMLSTTTRETSGWETAIPISQSYSITFTGVQEKTVGSSKISYDALKAYKRNRVLIEWKIEDAVNSITDYGNGYLVNIGETADAGDNLLFDGEIVGYGRPVTTVDGVIPTTPYLSLSGVTSSTVSMSWVAATDDIGVATYKIYRNNVFYDTVLGSVLEYTDMGVVNGLTYSYNVSALDAAGNESIKSNKITSGPISSPGLVYFQFQDASYFRFQDGTVYTFQ